MAEAIAAIILAGGQSTRMGQDKALLPLDSTPLLRRIYDTAQPCVSRVYVVTPWRDRYNPILPADCAWIEEPSPSPDAPQSPGPLVGFAQGLAVVETPWVLLLACDLPGLTVTALQGAIAQATQVPEQAIALLPKDERGWQPLCGLYRRACHRSLTLFLARGGRSFQRWLMNEMVVELQLPDPTLLFNCNTPTDWQRWHQHLRSTE